MELSIDQALARGIAAHEKGELKVAEDCYRAILGVNPHHPDALHRLGLLAVSVNKLASALPLFELAVKSTDATLQHWLSYVDALLKAGMLEKAHEVVERGQLQSLSEDNVAILRSHLLSTRKQNLGDSKSLPANSSLRDYRQAFGSRSENEVTSTEVIAAKEGTVDCLTTEILQCVESGQFDEAEHLANSLTTNFPGHPPGWKLLGQVLVKAKKIDRSIEIFRHVVSLSPTDADSLFTLAGLLQTVEKITEAETILRRVISLDPDQADPYFSLGNVLKRQGKLEEAEQELHNATLIDPQHARAFSNLGNVQNLLGKLDLAIQNYRRAVLIEPNLAQVHNNLGITLKKLGQLSDAEESLRTAVSITEDFPQAHNNLGMVLADLNRTEEAIACYRKAILTNPRYAEAHNNLGVSLKMLGQFDEARASYMTAVALDDGYATAFSNLGNLLLETSEFAKAKGAYLKAIEIQPSNPELHFNLGNTQKQLGDLEAARASYERAISISPNHADCYNNLGGVLNDLGRHSEAIEKYDRAIELRNDFKDARRNRWLLHFNEQNYESALNDADACSFIGGKQLDLTTLYAMGQLDEIYRRLQARSDVDRDNISDAAFASFISAATGKSCGHNFCPEPMGLISISNLDTHVADSSELIAEIKADISETQSIWAPHGQTTVNGFQTAPGANLFDSEGKGIKKLKDIIIAELSRFRTEYRDQCCSLITQWPLSTQLFGWHVTLKRQGHQTMHIHPSGWVSGVIYLAVVPHSANSEGAIEFSLNGKHYWHKNSPCRKHQPSQGDILLFPSSLHHRTLPFSADVDRVVVSFDLIP